VWIEVFTGLRADRFARLLRAVRERGGEHPRRGRPWRLPLAERVLLVAVYYRTNLTMRQLAVLFGVCPATVCRTIQQVGPLLSLEPAPRPEGAVERLWIVDGTLIPVRDRTVSASSRNYRFSANVQVVIDADTRLVVATAPPVAGNVADAHAFRDTGLAEVCSGMTVLADGAYGGTGLVIPHRRRGKRPLLPIQNKSTRWRNAGSGAINSYHCPFPGFHRGAGPCQTGGRRPVQTVVRRSSSASAWRRPRA